MFGLLWGFAGSASRGAAGAGAVAIFLYLVLRDGTRPRTRVVTRAVVAAVVLGVLGLAVYSVPVFPEELRARIDRIQREEVGVRDDRTSLHIAGVRLFAESPLVGVGLDNARYVVRSRGAASDQAPHNMWIQLLAQVGLIGTAAFATIIGRIVWLTWSTYRDTTGEDRRLTWALMCSMVAMLVIYLNTPLMIQRHYWLIFALALAWADVVRRRRTRTQVPA